MARPVKFRSPCGGSPDSGAEYEPVQISAGISSARSSGHGLFGCGRLYPISIMATAVFFGTAVLVSFLLWKVI